MHKIKNKFKAPLYKNFSRLILFIIFIIQILSNYNAQAFNARINQELCSGQNCQDFVGSSNSGSSITLSRNNPKLGCLAFLAPIVLPVLVFGTCKIKKLYQSLFCKTSEQKKIERLKKLGIKNPGKVIENFNTQEEKQKTVPFDIENAQTFTQWAQKCEKLPSEEYFDPDSNSNPEEIYKHNALTKEEFIGAIKNLIEILGKSSIGKQENWDSESKYSEKDFDVLDFDKDTDYKIPKNKFFAQKIIVPVSTENVIHADIHGRIKALIKFLSFYFDKGLINDNFKITDKNLYFVFLGDYSEKGPYGAEVLYTLARFMAANPEQVILHRGNHEDYMMNRTCGLVKHLFVQNDSERIRIKGELVTKFKISENYAYYLMQKLYNLMPSVTFIRPNHNQVHENINKTLVDTNQTTENNNKKKDLTEYTVYYHAGIEPRYDLSPLFKMDEKLERSYTQIKKLSTDWLDKETKNNYPKSFCHIEQRNDGEKIECTKIEIPTNKNILSYEKISGPDNGFLWTDHYIQEDTPSTYVPNRGNKLSKKFFDSYQKLIGDKLKIKIGFAPSGHEHGENMFNIPINYNGIYNMWAKKQWDSKSDKIEINNQYPIFKMNVSPNNMALPSETANNKANNDKAKPDLVLDIENDSSINNNSNLNNEKLNGEKELSTDKMPRHNYDTHMKIKFNGSKSSEWELKPCKISIF